MIKLLKNLYKKFDKIIDSNNPFRDISYIYDTVTREMLIDGIKLYDIIYTQSKYNRNEKKDNPYLEFKDVLENRYDSKMFYKAVRCIYPPYGVIVDKYKKVNDTETLRQIGISLVERMNIEFNIKEDDG